MPLVLADIIYPLTEMVANGVVRQQWGRISAVAFVPDDRSYLDGIIPEARCVMPLPLFV